MLNDLVEHFGGTWCATCLAQGGASVKYYPAPRLDSNPVNCGFWLDTDLSDNVQMSPLLYATIQRIRHARTLGVIRYIVWGQGATDGILGTDPEEFKTISTQLMAILRREAGPTFPSFALASRTSLLLWQQTKGRAEHTKATHGMKSRPPFRSIQSRIPQSSTRTESPFRQTNCITRLRVMCPSVRGSPPPSQARKSGLCPFWFPGCWLIWTPRIPIAIREQARHSQTLSKTRQTGKHRPNMISVSVKMIPSRPAVFPEGRRGWR